MTRLRAAPWMLVALLAAALYLPTVRFGFVLDDRHLVVDNAFLREPWSPLRVFAHHFWYGSTGAAAYYRPLVNASLAVNGRLAGWGAAGFHLANLLLHAANAALVVILADRLGAPTRRAVTAGTLLAVHPAASWAVASVVARVDLLPALFVLLAWIVYAGARGSPAGGGPGGADSGWRRPIAVGGLFLCALLSKESAVAFLIVPIADLRRARGDESTASRRPGATAIACGFAIAIAMALRRAAGAGGILGWDRMESFLNPLARVPFPARLYDAVRLSGRYLLFLPLPLRFSDPIDYAAPFRPDAGLFLAASGLVLIVATIAWLWFRRDPIAAPLAFLFVSFLPASNLIVPISSLYALNFLYLPLVGLCLVCGALPARARTPASSRALWMLAAPGVLLAALTLRETSIWRDGVTLGRAWIGRFPHYAFAYGSLGVARLDAGDPAGAVPPLRQALAIDDRSAETRYDLGLALMLTATDPPRLEEALRATRGALDLDPAYVEARVNASQILLRLDRPAEAETEARAALLLAPALQPAGLNLAEALYRQGRVAEAGGVFQGLLASDPGDPRLRSSYLLFLIDSGQKEEARRVAEEGRRDFPRLAWFDFGLARLEASAGRSAEAIRLLKSAIGKDAAARAWIARAPELRLLRGNADFEELAPP